MVRITIGNCRSPLPQSFDYMYLACDGSHLLSKISRKFRTIDVAKFIKILFADRNSVKKLLNALMQSDIYIIKDNSVNK